MPGDEEKMRLVDAGKRLPLNDRVVVTVFKETQPQWLGAIQKSCQIMRPPCTLLAQCVGVESLTA